MKLQGQAGSTELFELFQLLANSQKTGTLSVTRGEVVRKVQFTRSGVTLLYESEESRKRLGEILVHRGRMTRKELEKALELQKSTRRRLGELLIQTGVAKASEVNEALGYQLEEELFELLRWEDASFNFKEGVLEVEDHARKSGGSAGSPTRQYEANPYFDVSSILMEAARRADEWKRIHGVLTSSRTVLVRRAQEWDEKGDFDDPELVGRIWDLLDGTRNLEDLMERTAFSRFQVFEAAYQLHRAGLVQLITPEELLTRAEEKLVSGQTEYGLGLLAKACEGLENRPELQVQAGQLYFWAGRDEEARKTMDEALHQLIEEGQLEVALKFLESLHQQYPEKPYALERLIRLYREVPDFESARRFASDLLSLYHQNRESEKLHRLLKFLSEFPLGSEQSRLSLVKLLSSFGEVRLAAEQYEQLGKAAQKSRRKKDAIRYFRQALHLDSSRSEAHRQLMRLTVLPRVEGRRFLKRFVAAVVLLAMTGGMTAAIRNELLQRQDWKATEKEVVDLLSRREYDQAREVCGAFLERAVLTTAIGEAREQMQLINAAERGYQGRCTQQDRRLWRDAVRVEKKNDYEATLAAYETVAKQAYQESMARKARERIKELQGVRQQFEDLVSEAGTLESRGNYSDAIKKHVAAAALDSEEWARRKLTLPVKVTSEPKGAEVWQDGKLLGRTPLVARRGMDETPQFTVRMHGYLEGHVQVPTKGQPSELRVELRATRLPRWTCSLGGALDVPVQLDGSRVLVSSRSGQVASVETATGRVLWSKKVGRLSGTYVSQAVREGSGLYLNLGDGRVLKLSARSGTEVWSRDLSVLLSDSPLVRSTDGTVVSAGAGGGLFGLDREHGSIKWQLDEKHQTTWLLSTEQGFVSVGPTSVRHIIEKERSGQSSWSRTVGEGISGRPVIAGERVYVPGRGGVLTVLNLRTGAVVGRENLSGSGLLSPALSDGVLVVPDVSGTVRALEARSLRKVWTRSLGEPMSTGGSCHRGSFFIGTERGSLLSLNLHNGQLEWQAVLDGAVQAAPVLTGQLCLTGTRTGTLYAIALQTR